MSSNRNHRESQSRQTPTPNFSRQRPYSPTQIRQGSVCVIDGIPPYTQQCLDDDDDPSPSPGGAQDAAPWPDEPRFSLDFDFAGSNQSDVDTPCTSMSQTQKPRVTVNTRCTARTIEGTPIVTFISTTSIIAPPAMVQKPSSPVETVRTYSSDKVSCGSDNRSEDITSPNHDDYRRDLDLFPAPATYTVMDRPRPSFAGCHRTSDSSDSHDSFNLNRRSSAMPVMSSTTSVPPTLQEGNENDKLRVREQLAKRPSRARSISDISLMRGARAAGDNLTMTQRPSPPPRTSSQTRTNIHPAYRRVEWSDSQGFDHSSRSSLNLLQHVERPDLQHRRHTSDLEAHRRRNQEPPKGILKPSRDWDKKVVGSSTSLVEQKALQQDQANVRSSPTASTNTSSDVVRESTPTSPASSHDTSSSSFFSIYRHGRHSHSTSSNTSSESTASSAPTTVILFDDGNNANSTNKSTETIERSISDQQDRKASDVDRSDLHGFYGTRSRSSYDRYHSGYPRVVTIRTHDEITSTTTDRRSNNQDDAKTNPYSFGSGNKRRSLGNLMLGHHHKPRGSEDSSKSDASTKPMLITRPASTSALAAPPSSPVEPYAFQSNSSTSTIVRLVPPATTSYSSTAAAAAAAPSRAPDSPPFYEKLKPILYPQPPHRQHQQQQRQQQVKFSSTPYNPPQTSSNNNNKSTHGRGGSSGSGSHGSSGSNKRSILTRSNSASNSNSNSKNKPFTASSFDYSTLLSEKEAAKLRSRGVNPALYAEMRAMRKGKGLFGTLMGNAYVS